MTKNLLFKTLCGYKPKNSKRKLWEFLQLYKDVQQKDYRRFIKEFFA